MMLIAALASLAIVTQDQSALRSAPRDSAQQQAVLWQGDSVEIRGEQADYLQVYDHRRERAGFIRASQVRIIDLNPDKAAELMSVVRFVKDTPGAESLGIAYAAGYLKAAPAQTINSEAFDALGTMAERLARSASGKISKGNDTIIAAHIEVAAEYGVQMDSISHDGRVQLCYRGDAFRQVLAMSAPDEQQARAALAITRPDCIDPNLRPHERFALDNWRADVIDKIKTDNLPGYLKNRIYMRRAETWSTLAFNRSRSGEAVLPAGEKALQALAAINKSELTDEDQSVYNEAALSVGAVRWAAEANTAPTTGKVSIATRSGEPGQTCVLLVGDKHDATSPLISQCTYGTVWSASAQSNASGSVLALAVQPLDGWRELWLFRREKEGWSIAVMPPSIGSVELGYIEFSGWVPGNKQMLVTREVKIDGHFKRSFELINLETLDTEKHADKPESLNAFYRWQDPRWKRSTVSLR